MNFLFIILLIIWNNLILVFFLINYNIVIILLIRLNITVIGIFHFSFIKYFWNILKIMQFDFRLHCRVEINLMKIYSFSWVVAKHFWYQILDIFGDSFIFLFSIYFLYNCVTIKLLFKSKFLNFIMQFYRMIWFERKFII